MANINFRYPIEVRYGDLDPQGHVNNARYLTYLEQARIGYIRHLGLWESSSFLDVGIILAEARLTFRKPVMFGQNLQVRVWVSRMGNKSMTMEYSLEEAQEGLEYASASTVLVAYDYHTSQTIPIPAHWRQAISDFEGLPLLPLNLSNEST